MKLISMQKISDEQHSKHIATLEKLLDKKTYKPFDINELLDWLKSGKTQTKTRKGNAEDTLIKFTDKKDVWRGADKVHNNNGTLAVCNGGFAAVIFPDEQRDMNNAFITKQNGDKLNLSPYFNTENQNSITLSRVQVQSMLDNCMVAINDVKIAGNKVKKDNCVDLWLSRQDINCITFSEAKQLYKCGSKPMKFDAKKFELVLKFIMCTDVDEIKCSYSENLHTTLVFESGNLKTIICPMIHQWSNTNLDEEIAA